MIGFELMAKLEGHMGVNFADSDGHALRAI